MGAFSGLKDEIETIVSLRVNKIIKKNGFTERQSLSAIKLLLKGVLDNINKENFRFSDSIQKVASKGGTTEEGLKVLSKERIKRICLKILIIF